MKATRSASSSARLLSPAWVLLLVACAPQAKPTAEETNPPMASATVGVATPTPTPTPVVVAPDPVAAPTPEAPAAPPVPNAEPASLRLAFHGRCQYLGSSTVDGHTFVHYRNDARGWVHRMDEHGAIAETLPFDVPKEPTSTNDRSIDGVTGRWPEELVMLETYHERSDDYGVLHRWADGAWKSIAFPSGTGAFIYEGAWPWYNGSILAEARVYHGEGDEVFEFDRLFVVRGEPKAPSLAELERFAGCEGKNLLIDDVAVGGDRVTVLASCYARKSGSSSWVATWNGGKPGMTAKRVPGDVHGRTLHLDDQGQGLVVLEGGKGLLRWSGGALQAVELPSRKPIGVVVVAGNGDAWVTQGAALSRSTAQGGWEAVPIPKGSAIVQAAGLEHGTPWLLRKGGALSMQTADGTWHDIALPPTPDREQPPAIDTLRVVAPGDAWIDAKYSITLPPKQAGKRGKQQKLRAIYTTRDAPVPLQCGNETGASAGTS